jgi:hypothetical protein
MAFSIGAVITGNPDHSVSIKATLQNILAGVGYRFADLQPIE